MDYKESNNTADIPDNTESEVPEVISEPKENPEEVTDCEESEIAEEEKKPETEKNEEKKMRMKLIVSTAVLVLLMGTVFFTLEWLDVTHFTGISRSANQKEKEPQEMIKPPEKKPDTEEEIIKEIVTVGLADFGADYTDIPVDEETMVTFTARLETDEIPEGCEFGVYAIGRDEAICSLNDNGENGDEKAGDKIYSGEVGLVSDKVRTVEYMARASDEEAVKSSNKTKICFYKPITDEEFERFEKLMDILGSMDYILAKLYVRSSGDIESYSINEKKRSISFKTDHGINCVWEEKTRENYEVEKEQEELNEITLVPTVDKRDVAVIRPFAGEENTTDGFGYAAEQLKTALSGEVEIVDNDAVTLEFMKSLGGYGVILIDTEGVLIKNETPYIILGEEYTKNLDLSADLQSGRICIVNNRYAVNGDFFDKYYEPGDLDESLWVIGSGYGTYNQYITNALLAKGAEAVVGNQGEVPQKYSNEFLVDFVGNGLLAGDTVNDSLERADKNYKEQYPDEVIENSFEVKGNPDFCLVKQEEIKEEKTEEKPIPSQTKEEKKNYAWLIVLIILVVISVGAAVVWFIVLPRYKKSVDEPGEESGGESE